MTLRSRLIASKQPISIPSESCAFELEHASVDLSILELGWSSLLHSIQLRSFKKSDAVHDFPAQLSSTLLLCLSSALTEVYDFRIAAEV